MSQELNALLGRLHEELARTPVVDADARRLLSVVVADIEKLGVGTQATPGGLEELAVGFEADHPALAAALRQVADVLGKAGI
ncbi:MAG: DUF4404 family protein [Pseudomonadota bacterium]